MKFIITISRTYGSGGKEIGKLLAGELGIKCYDRDIFELAKNDDSTYHSDDENIHDATLAEADRQFSQLAETIRAVAEKESCVIVGRCADYILKDMDDVVKIYLHAPVRTCMRRVISLYELNPEDAKSLIHSMNKTRGDYYRHNTGLEWSDPRHYDLCLNTADLGTEKCIEVIKNYISIRFAKNR